MTVKELEDKVCKQDRIRIVIRDSSNAKVKGYTQTKAAQENWRITQFLSTRIAPLVKDREVAVIDGDGKMPNGNIQLKTIRLSYN